MEESTNVINVKKEKIKLVVLVLSILMIATSVTYAFFVAGISTPASTDVNIGSEVSESLSFTPGTPIKLTANLNNFAEGDGSLSGKTTSTANLKAASSAGSATENYYIYYNVTSNNFIYTKDNATPELLLTITDPEGNELTTLTNHPELTHKTVTDAVIGNVAGFDVTEYEGLILIDDSYTISTTDSVSGTTQEWKAKLTFINLDTVQTENEGKVFESELVLRSDEYSIPITEAILMHNGGIEYIESNPEPDFNQVATDTEGIFAAQDDYGTSYYYRGAVDNNWVSFAGFYWRIVRINGDGSVRIIYSGATQPDESQKVIMLGPNTAISINKYNAIQSSAEYVGYMYTVGEQHGLTIDSTIKTAIDTWYEENILNTEYHDMISDTLFCGDRTAYSDPQGTTPSSGFGSETTQFFGSHVRLYATKNPTLQCPEKEDSYTSNNEVIGNGVLKYSIGMLTGDEAALAGGKYGEININYYLYTNRNYWLNAPMRFGLDGYYNTEIRGMYIYNNGLINGGSINTTLNDIRPVVNLKSNILATGSGQWNDPYVVK